MLHKHMHTPAGDASADPRVRQALVALAQDQPASALHGAGRWAYEVLELSRDRMEELAHGRMALWPRCVSAYVCVCGGVPLCMHARLPTG